MALDSVCGTVAVWPTWWLTPYKNVIPPDGLRVSNSVVLKKSDTGEWQEFSWSLAGSSDGSSPPEPDTPPPCIPIEIVC